MLLCPLRATSSQRVPWGKAEPNSGQRRAEPLASQDSTGTSEDRQTHSSHLPLNLGNREADSCGRKSVCWWDRGGWRPAALTSRCRVHPPRPGRRPGFRGVGTTVPWGRQLPSAVPEGGRGGAAPFPDDGRVVRALPVPAWSGRVRADAGCAPLSAEEQGRPQPATLRGQTVPSLAQEGLTTASADAPLT